MATEDSALTWPTGEPTPRIKGSAVAVERSIRRPGTELASDCMSVMPNEVALLPVIDSTVIGTLWEFWLRRLAVTTISVKAPVCASLSAAGPGGDCGSAAA